MSSGLLPSVNDDNRRETVKITNVKATTLKGYKDWNFVRIETDEGIMGLGEAHPGEGITDVIVKRLKPLLVGKDPLNVEPLYHHMIGRTIGQSVGGTMLGAIGGVETALWDLAGKALSVPIYQLLGGKYRDRLRLYADVGWGSGESIRRRLGHNVPVKEWLTDIKPSSLTSIIPPMNYSTIPATEA